AKPAGGITLRRGLPHGQHSDPLLVRAAHGLRNNRPRSDPPPGHRPSQPVLRPQPRDLPPPSVQLRQRLHSIVRPLNVPAHLMGSAMAVMRVPGATAAHTAAGAAVIAAGAAAADVVVADAE